jgi:hypothetical protein
MYGAFKSVITRTEETAIAGHPMQFLKLVDTFLQGVPKTPDEKSHETPSAA